MKKSQLKRHASDPGASLWGDVKRAIRFANTEVGHVSEWSDELQRLRLFPVDARLTIGPRGQVTAAPTSRVNNRATLLFRDRLRSTLRAIYRGGDRSEASDGDLSWWLASAIARVYIENGVLRLAPDSVVAKTVDAFTTYICVRLSDSTCSIRVRECEECQRYFAFPRSRSQPPKSCSEKCAKNRAKRLRAGVGPPARRA